MPSFIYDEASDKMIPSEEYYFFKAMKKEHLHMTIGNQKVSFYYNSDQMEPTRHMASGKYFTSKKKFRDETKAYGCVEIGNDTASLKKARKPVKLDRRKRREDIRKAIHDLKNGNVPRLA